MIRSRNDVTVKPAYHFTRMWAQHFGATLVDSSVVSSKDECVAGFEICGAGKGALISEERLPDLDYGTPQSVPDTASKGYRVEYNSAGRLFGAELSSLREKAYITLAKMPRPTGHDKAQLNYRLQFEARYLPGKDTLPAKMGMGLIDSRGWESTRSGKSCDGKLSEQWESYNCQCRSLPDTDRMDLVMRLLPTEATVSGIFEVRNVKITPYIQPVFPAYDLITVRSSLSADKGTLYVIAFNKSLDQSIKTTIQLRGFTPLRARLWQINADDLLAEEISGETISGIAHPMQGQNVVVTLPPHSMTAIELLK